MKRKINKSSFFGSRRGSSEMGSLFWTIALILFVRAFVVEPFKIPSGSMLPTLLIGDHLFVAKSAYDINLGIPFTSTNKNLLRVSDPKRGDVVVFKFPDRGRASPHSGKNYIKRVIGIPGDVVKVVRGVPIVNGIKLQQDFLIEGPSSGDVPGFDFDPNNELHKESIPEARADWHWVQRIPDSFEPRLRFAVKQHQEYYGTDCVEVGLQAKDPTSMGPGLMRNQICEFKVPPESYFVMGDNRDDSSDGRAFGFVPRNLIKGRALVVWLSLPLGDRNIYMGPNPIMASIKDFFPSLIRMFNSSDHLSRVGMTIK